MLLRCQKPILLLLILSLLVPGVFAADEPVITLLPAKTTLDVGETATVAIVMSADPIGLSGFNVTVSITDPSIGEITAVSYPEWAEMPVSSSLPSDSLFVMAVDLRNSVEAGATNISLCMLTVRGDVAGETNLTVTSMKIDDDVSGRYTPGTTEAVLIVKNPPAVAVSFTANATCGTPPLTVQFTDTSASSPTSWLWTCGDNATSTEQHPTHTFSAFGNYTVTLSINGGADTCTRPAYIKVTPLLYGDANGNAVVDQADTLRVLKQVVGLSTKPAADTELFAKTDVHGNGAIEVGDALFIAQYNVGLRDAWFALIE